MACEPSAIVHDLHLRVNFFVICTGQLSDRGVKLTWRSRFLPPSSFQDLDFNVSCSENLELWPDDQHWGADGNTSHLIERGLCNLLQRVRVHREVMSIYKCHAQLAHKQNSFLSYAKAGQPNPEDERTKRKPKWKCCDSDGEDLNAIQKIPVFLILHCLSLIITAPHDLV